MTAAPARDDESDCLRALHELAVIGSPSEPAFDALVQVAARLCGVPISFLSLVDEHIQWIKAEVGVPDLRELPRELSFCAHAVRGATLFEIGDTHLDKRFFDNPLVTGPECLRFYAGMPIRLSDGSRVGSLCVIDHVPRSLTADQRHSLEQLAIAAACALEGRLAALKLEAAHAAAEEGAERLREEMERRAHAHERAVQSAESLEEAQRLGQIGSWEWHVDPDRTAWSPQMHRIFGWPLEQPLPSFAERERLYVPESWQRLRDAVIRARTDGTPFALELQMVRFDGTHGWLDARGEALRDVAGNVHRLHGTAQDITARKAAEIELARSQDFLERTGRMAGVGGWEVDLEQSRVLWSPEVSRIHGLEVGFQPSLEQALSFYAPESRPAIEAAVNAAIEHDRDFDVELEIVRQDGERRWVRSVGQVDRQDGRAVRLAGAFQDVTERRRLVSKLREQHELLRVTLQSIGEAVITTEPSGRINWLNPVAEQMTGWSREEASGKALETVLCLFEADGLTAAPSPLAALHESPVRMTSGGGLLLRAREGHDFGIETSVSPIRSNRGDQLGAVVVLRDVTQQRRIGEEMHFRATHDLLTGLANRAEFESRLSRLLGTARLHGAAHALMFIDLDRFKIVNDSCGHAAGDRLLQQIASLLQEGLPESALLARLGGDEFAILLEAIDLVSAQALAQRICDRVEVFRFDHAGKRFRIGASIGLVPLDARWATPAAALQAADSACYAAKDAGRQRVHVWVDSDLAMQNRLGQMQWASRIEQALEEGRFVLFAQRICPLRSGDDRLHAEALLRWVDADGSLVLPDSFVPAAERFNLASRIDRWVLRRAIELLASHPALNRIDSIGLNLSGQSVGDPSFHAWAIERLQKAGPEVAACLCLEITETSAITNMQAAAGFIAQVRTLGVRVALDDFGSGASSFSYLKSLPVDMLKIDGQFVKALDQDALDMAAVRCFLDVARVLSLRTVAEHVDRPEVLAELRRLGVDDVQGFLMHAPQPLEELLRAAAIQDLAPSPSLPPQADPDAVRVA